MTKCWHIYAEYVLDQPHSTMRIKWICNQGYYIYRTYIARVYSISYKVFYIKLSNLSRILQAQF